MSFKTGVAALLCLLCLAVAVSALVSENYTMASVPLILAYVWMRQLQTGLKRDRRDRITNAIDNVDNVLRELRRKDDV